MSFVKVCAHAMNYGVQEPKDKKDPMVPLGREVRWDYKGSLGPLDLLDSKGLLDHQDPKGPLDLPDPRGLLDHVDFLELLEELSTPGGGGVLVPALQELLGSMLALLGGQGTINLEVEPMSNPAAQSKTSRDWSKP